MDATKFDALARRLGNGLSRRAALRGLAAGAAAAAVGAVAHTETSARLPDRCLRAGQLCNSNAECCTRRTGRICDQPNPPSGSEVCCSPLGEPCGGENRDGPVKPQCCQDFKCSSRQGGVCIRK